MSQNRPINNDPYRTTPRTWRSNINSRDLTILMKRALRQALNNRNELECNKNVLNALVKRNLCYPDNKLTNEGIVVAIEESSLLQQAKSLSITIETIELKLEGKARPDISALNHLLANRNIKTGCYAE